MAMRSGEAPPCNQQRAVEMHDTKFQSGISYLDGSRPIFLGTPFLECTAPLNANALWMRWGNYMVVDTYSNLADELKAIRERVAMADMSPLAKYRISGLDAEAFLDRLSPRNVSALDIGQIYYTPWCNDEGKMLGDGLIIRESQDSFITSSDPMLQWFQSRVGGDRVEILDLTDRYGILTVQGPRSRDTLQAAADTEFPELPFSRQGRIRIAGHEVSVIRQGFTGEHGYELWVERETGPAIWRAIAEAGQAFGILPAGAWALDVARIEAGLLIVGYDYVNAGPDAGAAGVHASGDLQATPFDLGLGRLIDFQSGDFAGAPALAEIAAGRRHRNLVGVEIDWKHLEDLEPGNLRRVRWYPVDARRDGTRVGFVSSIVWSPTLRKLVGFAHLDPDCATHGDEIALDWPLQDGSVEVSARVCNLPFHSLKRSKSV